MASPASAIVVDDTSSSSSPPIVLSAVNDSSHYTRVYQYFEKSQDGGEYNTCTYQQCGVKIAVHKDGSTSNMHQHLRNSHKLKFVNNAKSAPPPPPPASKAPRTLVNFFSNTPSSTTSSSRPPPTTAQKKQWTGELLRLAIEMNVSFCAATQSTVLRAFMCRELQWEMPSRTALRRLVPKHYGALMSDLRAQLREVDSISITTDSTFLTRHQVPYISITGHWIDKSWALHHTVLAVFLAEQGETGNFIATRLREVLEGELGLSEKLHCVVTDEGQIFLCAVTILKQMEVLRESLRCACHRIQLTVKGAMTNIACKELMGMVKKCQDITLQFKNGWVSRKRDILRKYQDRYVKEQEEMVGKLRQEIAEHSTRLKQEALVETQKLLAEAQRLRDEQLSEWKAEREEKAAINHEVSELWGGVSSGAEGSDSDDDPDNDAAAEKELDDEKFDIDALVNHQMEIKAVIAHIGNKKALVQMAATRWMTYVAVVERTLMWRTALQLAFEEISADSSFRKKKSANSDIPLTSLRISDDEALVLEQFRGIGASCRKTLVALEADDFPTIRLQPGGS